MAPSESEPPWIHNRSLEGIPNPITIDSSSPGTALVVDRQRFDGGRGNDPAWIGIFLVLRLDGDRIRIDGGERRQGNTDGPLFQRLPGLLAPHLRDRLGPARGP